mgnify:CR=1 FL=1
MLYFSLNNNSPKVDFKEASIKGQAPDKGLYFPESIAKHEKDFFKNIEQYTNDEIAYRAIEAYAKESIPESILEAIVKETVNFPIPLVKVSEDVFSLEMFHGNTLAFKDIGARFMSRCLGYFVKDNELNSISS